ncbi:M16 family metallopeptidase [Blattabacterium cuenoti]|uniref:M16 family metallopeptidase n=1 Tax=Blattabacterium cuenoti TaxID=1653831 RepID=UPI00163D29AA|nr:pitrilysin family protein [Blattabacterium cuenoti]
MKQDQFIPPKLLNKNININIQEPIYFHLKNGLQVFLVENHKLPLVKIILEIDSAPFLEKDKSGMQKVFGKMLRAGTKNYTKEELESVIDYMGINLDTSFSEITISTLKKYLNKSISILVDILINCKFSNNSELEKVIKQTKININMNEKNPNFVLKRVKNLIYFGKNHPYGECETIDSINNITLYDLKKLYKKYYIPNRFYISFVGDISKKEVKYLCKNYLSKWKKKPYVDKYKEIPTPSFDKMDIYIVDMPFLTQSSICFGKTVFLRKNDPLYISSIIANSILGDGPYSRLFLNLREKNAYTYGICSVLEADRNIGYFSIYTQVRNEVTKEAIKNIINEISDFVSKKISLEELNVKKQEIIGQFLLDLEDSTKISDLFVCEKKNKLPYGFYRNFIKKIKSVTIDDISNTCKEFFPIDVGSILIIGNSKEIFSSIKDLGYPVHYLDINGNFLKKNV